jgi:hypothetical protein
MANLQRFIPSFFRWIKLLVYAGIAATCYVFAGTWVASEFTRRAKDEVSDQRILSLINLSHTNPTSLTELAEIITDSNPASLAFEDLLRSGSFNGHLALLSNVHAIIRKRHGVRFNREGTPGFFAPWRIIEANPRDDIESWLTTELVKCIPGHLHLLTNIYYYWIGTDRTPPAKREGPRRAIVDALRKSWGQNSPTLIAAGFNPAFPYILFHLIFTTEYEKPEKVPLGNINDWSWSGPPLLRAAQVEPDVMLPQLCVALNAQRERAFEAPKFEFDDQKMSILFGKKTDDFITLVAKGFQFHEDVSEQTRYMLGLAIECAKKRTGVT